MELDDRRCCGGTRLIGVGVCRRRTVRDVLDPVIGDGHLTRHHSVLVTGSVLSSHSVRRSGVSVLLLGTNGAAVCSPAPARDDARGAAGIPKDGLTSRKEIMKEFAARVDSRLIARLATGRPPPGSCAPHRCSARGDGHRVARTSRVTPDRSAPETGPASSLVPTVRITPALGDRDTPNVARHGTRNRRRRRAPRTQ